MSVGRAAVLGSKRCLQNEGAKAIAGIKVSGIDVITARFNGECSLNEIERQVEFLKSSQIDCLVALGGGKTVDAGKCIADRLKVPVAIAPTLASNDAPCSALSVVYNAQGIQESVEYFTHSPNLVLVDTDVIAEADERFLVAGMGDAMATFYEARVCLNNRKAVTPAGARPTLAAYAISEICAKTLYEYGEAAAAAVAKNKNDETVEKIVEANTLLSGVGFESGGLAMAHPLALAYTHIDRVHNNHLHGEMVAISTLAQLALEKSNDIQSLASFFARIGLPVHLGQLSMSRHKIDEINMLAEVTMANPNVHNMPMELDQTIIKKSIIDADAFGRSITEEIGDAAYLRLHE